MLRDSCPISSDRESAEIQTVLSLPFDRGILGAWAEKKRKTEQVAGREFRIYHDPRRDFFWQQFVLTNEEETERRTRVRQTKSEARPPTLTEAVHKTEEAILLRLLTPAERPKVLDYGMGLGHWLLAMRAFGAEAWGTDIDPLSAVVAAENGLRFEANLDDLPDGYFDFINSDQVFEHLPDPLRHLERITPKLSPGGILKLSTPGDERMPGKLSRLARGGYSDLGEFQRDFDSLSPLCHINLFTARSLRALGEAAGLNPFRIPLKTGYGAMTGFFSPRQWNRNLYNPWKRSRASRTWQYFRKSGG